MKHALGILLLALTVLPVSAFEHAKTGLRIDLPETMRVEPIPRWDLPPDTIGFSIRTRDPGLDPDLNGEICKLAFSAKVERSPLTQVELNNIEAGDMSLETYRTVPVAGMKVLEVMPFLSGDIAGSEIVATSKHAPGFKMLVSTFLTPAGRTVLACAAERAEFEAERPGFVSIRDRVVPPR